MTNDQALVDTIKVLREQVTMWKERALNAEFEATHDTMTGCLNRKGLYAAHAAHSYKYAYVIDVDGLKTTNDTYGHAIGDALIVAVVAKLNEMAAAGAGVVARIGGDEFVILVDSLILTGSVEHFSHGWVRLEEGLDLSIPLAKADARMYTRKIARKSSV